MKKVDDASVDLLLTDPPYGMNFLSGQRRKAVHGRIQNDKALDWLEPFVIEAKRVLKPEAHVYIFCSHHNLDVFLAIVKKHLSYKSLLVWEKGCGGMGDLKGDYSPMFEFIIFCNGGKPLNGSRSKNILKFKRTGNKLHPTEKPVDMFEFLISKSTAKGDLVLDAFGGSGTMGIAADNLARNWILMEKDEKYYKVCVDRINNNRKRLMEVFYS